MKPSILSFLAFSLLILLPGCDIEEVSGYYYSDHGDALRIKKDGEVLWSPLSKTKDDFEPIGFLEWNEAKKESNLVMSSNHPYIGSQLTFSEDLQKIKMKWNRYDGQTIKFRGTTYTKRK